MGSVIAIIVLLVVILDFTIAYFFSEIAELKGYSMVKYYLICVFFMLAGWIMVCALPNKNSNDR